MRYAHIWREAFRNWLELLVLCNANFLHWVDKRDCRWCGLALVNRQKIVKLSQAVNGIKSSVSPTPCYSCSARSLQPRSLQINGNKGFNTHTHNLKKEARAINPLTFKKASYQVKNAEGKSLSLIDSISYIDFSYSELCLIFDVRGGVPHNMFSILKVIS